MGKNPGYRKGSYIYDVRFFGGLGGSSKIGQNRKRGVGSLAKIGHSIILVFFPFFHKYFCYNLPIQFHIFADRGKSVKFWKPPIKYLYIKLLEGGGHNVLEIIFLYLWVTNTFQCGKYLN